LLARRRRRLIEMQIPPNLQSSWIVSTIRPPSLTTAIRSTSASARLRLPTFAARSAAKWTGRAPKGKWCLLPTRCAALPGVASAGRIGPHRDGGDGAGIVSPNRAPRNQFGQTAAALATAGARVDARPLQRSDHGWRNRRDNRRASVSPYPDVSPVLPLRAGRVPTPLPH